MQFRKGQPQIFIQQCTVITLALFWRILIILRISKISRYI